jgi:hypothetical protein
VRFIRILWDAGVKKFVLAEGVNAEREVNDRRKLIDLLMCFINRFHPAGRSLEIKQ